MVLFTGAYTNPLAFSADTTMQTAMDAIGSPCRWRFAQRRQPRHDGRGDHRSKGTFDHPWAGLRSDETYFAASLVKIASMYAAGSSHPPSSRPAIVRAFSRRGSCGLSRPLPPRSPWFIRCPRSFDERLRPPGALMAGRDHWRRGGRVVESFLSVITDSSASLPDPRRAPRSPRRGCPTSSSSAWRSPHAIASLEGTHMSDDYTTRERKFASVDNAVAEKERIAALSGERVWRVAGPFPP